MAQQLERLVFSSSIFCLIKEFKELICYELVFYENIVWFGISNVWASLSDSTHEVVAKQLLFIPLCEIERIADRENSDWICKFNVPIVFCDHWIAFEPLDTNEFTVEIYSDAFVAQMRIRFLLIHQLV